MYSSMTPVTITTATVTSIPTSITTTMTSTPTGTFNRHLYNLLTIISFSFFFLFYSDVLEDPFLGKSIILL